MNDLTGKGSDKINLGSDGSNHTLITVTRPDTIIRHEISDEELDILCSPSDLKLAPVLWTAVGAFSGSVPSAVPALFSVFQEQEFPLTPTEFLHCLIFTGSFCVAAVVGFATLGQQSSSENLVKKIRSRK